ncbi:flagellar hook-associated protein FlgL [Shimia sp. SK013]|uniref:flagellin n=1 Tax=Shimia sp. SK013 TaxID=1389006 RepID=UPI0006B57F7E|nr:flagellin [Shimia sp. SK013]KPA20351.1 flagellar hook-associated protein FlgL [Shimia sp. SK013]
MAVAGLGTLARHLAMQNQMTSVKSDFNRLGQELASGLKSDIGASVGGDFRALNDIERQLTVLDSYDQSTLDAKLFTGAMQANLDRLHSMSANLANSLITTVSSGTAGAATTASDMAMQDFESMVDTLNGRSADKSLFAGAATDGAATIPASEMMTHLSAAVAGSVTMTDVITAIDDWFMAPGGGFETVGYLGSANQISPFQLSETESTSVQIKADNEEIRQLLRDTAIAAIANDPGLALNSTDKLALLDTSGKAMLTNQDAIIQSRANLGYSEERIEIAATGNAASRASFSIARNDIATVDATEVAAEFQAVQLQLEMVYTITARLNSMSFMDYM